MKKKMCTILTILMTTSIHASSTPRIEAPRIEKRIELSAIIDPATTKRSTKHNIAQLSAMAEINPEQARTQRKFIARSEITEPIERTMVKKPDVTPISKPIGNLDFQNPKQASDQPINFSEKGLEHIQDKTTDEFVGKLNNTFKKFITKTVLVTVRTRIRLISYLSLSDMFVVSIKHFLFAFSNIPEHFKSPKNNAFNNFRKQIQYLAQQISNYNSITIYKDPQAMLQLMLLIQQFLQENNEFPFSSPMLINLDQAISTAITCCNIFKNQNMIFSSSNTPAQIIRYFQPVIDNTNNLDNNKFTNNLMHAIYNDGGYTYQIIETWQKFTTSDLNQTPTNRHYAAFLTFLLLFENMIVATAVIIDQTSALYKVTNPVPVVIDIA
jgi:hypothetical protein